MHASGFVGGGIGFVRKGFEDGKIAVVVPNELAPKLVLIAFVKFGGGLVDGFEEGGGEASEGGGALGVEAAFGDSAESASERLGEGSSGNEIVGERFSDFGSGVVAFAEVAELAFVEKAELGSGRSEQHAASAAIGIDVGTHGGAIIGIVGRHRILLKK